MNPLTRSVSVLLLSIAGLLAGCARFAHPAVTESGPSFDTALEGRWSLVAREEHVEILIRRQGTEGILTVLEEQDGQATEEARLIIARLGPLKLMSLQSQAGADRYWSIYRYDVEGARLIITPGSDDYWQEAIEEGRLPGTVDKHQPLLKLTVTAGEAQLRDTILADGAMIFADDPTPEFVFERR